MDGSRYASTIPLCQPTWNWTQLRWHGGASGRCDGGDDASSRRLETNQPVHVLGESYLPQSSTTLLYLVEAGAGVLLLLSSVDDLSEDRLVLQLRRRYCRYCMERLLGWCTA